MKTGAAVVGGVTLGNTYIKPEVQSVSLSQTAYASGEPAGDTGGGRPEGKEKPHKKPKADKQS